MTKKYIVAPKICTGCGGCAALCPVSAIVMDAVKATIIETCIGCSICADFCPIEAISKESE